MAENTIEVILRSIDEMSVDLEKAEKRLDALGKTSETAAKQTESFTQRSAGLHRQIIPLVGAVSQVTNAAARLNPEMSVAIRASDNLAFSMVRAASAARTTGGALTAALTAAFNPLTLAIVAASTALGYFISKLIETREAQQKLDLAFATNNVGLFDQQIQTLRERLEKVRKEQQAIANAPATGAATILGVPFAGPVPGGAARAEQLRQEELRLTGDIAKIETQRQQAVQNIAEITFEMGTAEAEINRLLRDEKSTIDQIMAAREALLRIQLKAKGLPKETIEQAIGTARPELVAATQQTVLQRLAAAAKAQEEEFAKRATGEEIIAARQANRILLAKGELDILNDQLLLLQQQGASRDAILAKAREIDEAESALIEAKRKQLEYEKLIAKAKSQDLELTAEERAAAEQRVRDLEVQLATLRRGPSKAGALSTQFQTEFKQFLDQSAQGFSQAILDAMEGHKVDWQRLLINLIAKPMLEGLFKNMFEGILKQFFFARGKGGGFDIFTIIKNLFKFAHGGMVIPPGAMRAFQHGGVVRGPTLGMIGEEGPEIVARMKPALPGREEGKVQVIINGDITPRRPNMTPDQVIQVIANDIDKKGPTGRMVERAFTRIGP